MCCKGFFKRVAPFFLTLAVGLFIASFFVTIVAPRFPFGRGFRNKHQQYHQKMESENRELKIEKSRLESELRQEKIRNQSDFTHEWENKDSDYPLIRENQNFQPRIENQDVTVQPRKSK